MSFHCTLYGHYANASPAGQRLSPSHPAPFLEHYDIQIFNKPNLLRADHVQSPLPDPQGTALNRQVTVTRYCPQVAPMLV